MLLHARVMEANMDDEKEFEQNAFGDFNRGDYVRGDVKPSQPLDVDEDRIEDGALAEPSPVKDRP